MPDLPVSQDIDDFMQSATDAAARAELGCGTAATNNTGDFATSIQGGKADTALQSGDNITQLTNNAGFITSAPVDSVNLQTGTVLLDSDDISDSGKVNKFVTANQLLAINSALQSGANISELTNNAGYITSAPVDSVNSQVGTVLLDADDISDAGTTNKFATQIELNKANSALQSGDNVSALNNDAGYLTTAPAAPVDSVNTKTGVVVLDADDIADAATTNKFATAAQLANADSALQSGANISVLNNDSNYLTTSPNWYVTKMGDEASDSSGVGEKTAWIAPASGEITGVHSGSSTVTAGGTLTVDVKKNGTTILSTLGIINTADDSTTTGTAHVLTTSPTSFSAGDRISFEINTFGGTGAKGLHTDLLITWD